MNLAGKFERLSLLLSLVIAAPIFVALPFSVYAITVTDTTSNAGAAETTAAFPAGATQVLVECWGAGGGGAGDGTANGASSGYGGGGGAYASRLIAVTPGLTYSYTVGLAGTATAGGNGGNGGGSSFTGDGAVQCVAAGGNGGTTSAIGAGGTTAASSGTTLHKGGDGAAPAGVAGGGGGASAGPTLDGNPGSGTSGGTAVLDGGPGGAAGVLTGDQGVAPISGPGGGGGGSADKTGGNEKGGTGYDGQVRYTYIDGFSIAQPDGVSDTVTAGDTYNITYTLTDTTGVATVTFYYDTDATGYNGTLITSCQNQAEGSNATCAWNTTGMTPGTYYVYGVASDGTVQGEAYSSGQITINAANVQPTLSISQPDGSSDTIAQNGTYNITYTLSDPDNVVTAALYYDTNNSGYDGVAIAACSAVAEGTNSTCSWDTTGLSPGTYYIYGITNDGTGNVESYSSGPVTINAAPTFSISQPDGVSDSVTVGGSYNITYTLSDSDNVVTAVFYYDSDNSGYNGTAISGACASAAEGAGATCSWNTTGMTPGTYYVYATVSDGVNGPVSAYSPGQITITSVAPSLSISQPDGVSDSVVIGSAYNITYSLSDPDNVVTAAFYYDTDNTGQNGVAISGPCAAAAEGTGAICSWDTTGVPAGTYYIYGLATDGTTQASAYSSGPITISSAAPSISITSPNGSSVASGRAFDITYNLNDADDVVTAAFYYDTDNAGYNGTPISGACATAAEGTGAICSWDTTGVPLGTYYIYGQTTDGTTNAQAYSGSITITAAKETKFKLPKNFLTLGSGLVGYWTFDGGDLIQNAIDASGNGNTGYLIGFTSTSSAQTKGKLGQALNFVSSSDYIATKTDLIGTGEVTICAWVYPRSYGLGSFSDYGTIVGNGKTNLGVQSGALAGKFRLLSNGSNAAYPSSAVYSMNQWTHVCAYRDANGIASMYINGASVSMTQTNSGTPTAGSPVEIGNNPTSNNTNWDGYIDDVRIYNRALSTDEIKTLFAISKGSNIGGFSKTPHSNGLVGWWTFDGNRLLQNVVDSSGNNFNGYWSGGATTTEKGKLGQALSFDGTNDSVTIPDNSTLRPGTGDWAITAWIKPPNEAQNGAGFVSKRLASGSYDNIMIGVGAKGATCTNVAGKNIFLNLVETTSTDWWCAYSTADVVDGKWHHVIFERQNGVVLLYVDGVSVPVSVTTNAGTGTNANISNTQPWTIGSNGDTIFYKGLIDDVRLYNRAISAGEAIQLYKEGSVRIVSQ